jgi:hypothetical protein
LAAVLLAETRAGEGLPALVGGKVLVRESSEKRKDFEVEWSGLG